jgi:phytanoyl-CoA hydroxylase
MALTQEQLDFFFENGYVNCGKVLDDTELQTMRAEYDQVFKIAEEKGGATNLAASKNGEAPTQKRMLQIMNVCERNIHFRKLLYHSKILDIVQDLIGPNIMLFHDQALYKPAFTGGAVFWHQDNAYWQCVPANLVSCWMTLDDAFRDNGAMQVIPGSHLKPARHDAAKSTDRLKETEVDESKAVVVDVPAGGCMIHHCQTLHYTAPNTTDKQRRAFAIHFMPFGTRGREKEIMRASFSHPILRMNQ